MNTKGIAQILTIMLAVVFIILALVLAGPVKSFVDNARNTTSEWGAGLDCENSSISTYDQATCVTTDLFTPTYLAIIIGLAGVLMGARIIFSR